MKKNDAVKWVNALRSGKYKQGNGYLYNKEDDSYCCLGVLNKIMPYKYPRTTKVCISRNIPETLRSTKLFKNGNGTMASGATLTEHNDGVNTSKKTFNEIADIIDMRYEEL